MKTGKHVLFRRAALSERCAGDRIFLSDFAGAGCLIDEMQIKSDAQLLRKYAEQGSEPAFAEIVARHTDLVYSAACRQSGSPELAGEVAQSVFTDLARKARALAGGLSAEASLAGWLYRGTRLATLNLLRVERRRQAHERLVMENFDPAPATVPDWERVAPMLDEAMADLGDADREAVLLRYFQNQDFQMVGLALGVSDDAAQKRVSRAVEHLREFLAKRGVAAGASGLVLVIAANSVQAAPAGLAISLAAAAVKGTAAAATNLALMKGALKLLAWTNTKTAIAVGLGILLAAGTAVVHRSSQMTPGGRLRLPVGAGVPVISMGASHGLILASDGSLWSWGTNFAGWPVLGLGQIQMQPSLHRIGADHDWTTIASSFTHSLALKANGTLWGWGQDLYGQLGVGRSSRRDTKRSTPVPTVPGNDWKQVAAGGGHSLALRSDGTLWAWGINWGGQLGIGSTNSEVRQVTQVGTATNWTKVWAAAVQTVGQQSDGTLWFWGSLTGSDSDTSRFFVPTRVSAETNWVDVAFGYFTIFAIKADGTLWVWGLNAGMYTGKTIQATF